MTLLLPRWRRARQRAEWCDRLERSFGERRLSGLAWTLRKNAHAHTASRPVGRAARPRGPAPRVGDGRPADAGRLRGRGGVPGGARRGLRPAAARSGRRGRGSATHTRWRASSASSSTRREASPGTYFFSGWGEMRKKAAIAAFCADGFPLATHELASTSGLLKHAVFAIRWIAARTLSLGI